MTVIYSVEAACDWAGCDEYLSRSYVVPATGSLGTRWLRRQGWSVRRGREPDGEPGTKRTVTLVRCVEHRGKRSPRMTHTKEA